MWSFVKLIFLSNNWILIRVLIKSFPKLFFMCLFMLLLLQSRLMMHFIHLIILVLRLIIKRLSYLFFFETAVPESSQTDESNARPKRAGKAPWYLADYHCPFVDTSSFTLFPIFTTNHFASVINTFWKRQVVRKLIAWVVFGFQSLIGGSACWISVSQWCCWSFGSSAVLILLVSFRS